MEKGLTLLEEIRSQFGSTNVDIKTYSPLTFAYVGDGIYEMVIRTLIVEKGQRAANTFHKHTTRIVCAQTQARMIEALMDELTEEEVTVFRRAKNAKLNSAAKNATIQDYRKATGFEAVCGYLYLSNQTGRMVELIKRGIELLEIEI